MLPTLRRLVLTIACVGCVPMALEAQDAGAAREAARVRRDARREARTSETAEPEMRRNGSMAERERVEGTLRSALARAVRERLNLNDQQASRLMDVNRRFGDDRIRLTRDELRIRRDLRQSIADRDSSRAPETARLLDGLLEVQRQRLELQQKEQSQLSEFLTPEQRARYIAMMDQLRRRIQTRADSGRGGAE